MTCFIKENKSVSYGLQHLLDHELKQINTQIIKQIRTKQKHEMTEKRYYCIKDEEMQQVSQSTRFKNTCSVVQTQEKVFKKNMHVLSDYSTRLQCPLVVHK